MPTGRFAPSPTGPLHLGNLRTAMLAWLFARVADSTFLLRVEDLDPQSSRRSVEQGQIDDLAALGLDWDGPVVRQSERRDRHEQALERLDADGRLFACYCTRREVAEAARAPHGHQVEHAYPGTCRHLSASEREEREAAGRRAAWRLDARGAVVEIVDRLAGPVRMAVDDFVVRRNDGTPSYNLAVVVDDADQGVGEVVRGDDLLATTPRQALLAELLDLDPPTWAHVPLVLGPDGRRLAKRHGAITLADLAERGVTPSTVRSRLATTVGLAAPGEPVTMSQLVARFDPDALQRTPSVVDPIDW